MNNNQSGSWNILKNKRCRTCLIITAFIAATSVEASQKDSLVGDWCFYEQEGYGRKVPEKVDVSYNQNGAYVWIEGQFKQEGVWNISDGKLEMTNVGSHSIISIGNNEMELRRGSIMRFKKGKCNEKSFSDQDITAFHNGASTGDKTAVELYLSKGIDVDVVDWNRRDTALIKAAKFCQIEVAKQLIQRGANKGIKNEEGKVAHEYAKSSRFHQGCDELVKLLQ